jgi:hypothetical protein
MDRLQEVDSAILDVVMAYIVEHRGNLVHRLPATRNTVIVGRTSLGNSLISQSQVKTVLSETQWRDASSLIDDLRFRNAESVGVEGMLSSLPLVRVEALDVPAGFPDPWAQFEETYPDAVGFVRLSLPAHSDAAAVVAFVFGPTDHGAFGILYLAREAGGWTVKWMATANFM